MSVIIEDGKYECKMHDERMLGFLFASAHDLMRRTAEESCHR